MQIIRHLLIAKIEISSLTTIDVFNLNTLKKSKKSLIFLASGMVRSKSGNDEARDFRTGFFNVENTDVWGATYRQTKTVGSEMTFAITGGVAFDFQNTPIYWRANNSVPTILTHLTLVLGLVEPATLSAEKSFGNEAGQFDANGLAVESLV
jgi:hypothetical protein